MIRGAQIVQGGADRRNGHHNTGLLVRPASRRWTSALTFLVGKGPGLGARVFTPTKGL